MQADRDGFDSLLQTQLDQIDNGPPETAGIALGQYVALQVLNWRANDGSSAVVPYTPGTGPGVWQPTPRPGPTTGTELPGLPAATPQWPYVTPFALTSGDQFRPGPPPRADRSQIHRGLPGGQVPGQRHLDHADPGPDGDWFLLGGARCV